MHIITYSLCNLKTLQTVKGNAMHIPIKCNTLYDVELVRIKFWDIIVFK